MGEKAMLVPPPGDGENAREILRQIHAEAARRGDRPIGKATGTKFAEALRNARYLDQQHQRRAG